MKRQFSLREIEEARINNQRTLSGTSASDTIPGAKTATFFLYGVLGEDVTITIDGTTIGVFSFDNFTHTPIRVDGTVLALSAGATSYLYYFVIEHGFN